MKPKYPNYKSAITSLIAVAIGGIFFVACKKDSSVENTNQAAATEETISSRAGSGNQAPRSKAGNDQTITLPTNSTNFDGSGSSDADGSIASYQWTKEVGPAATIASPTSAKTAVTGLTGGSYRFRLTVTDNRGATGTDTVHLNVNGTGGGTPTNQAPTVNAGTDKTVTLPASSVSLTGTASDADGTVASYLWTKVSGSGGTIASANSATTNITGLTAGSYVFSLKATDNQGATATDNVTVTVGGTTTNQPPTVNAGTDKLITMPLNSVSLTGTASDPNGTIASYLWTKVSGSGGTIASANAATTNITGLTAGSYVFSLKATDNQGATATDNVTVTVNGATQDGGDNPGYTLVYSTGYDDVNSIDPFGHDQWGSGTQASHLSTTILKSGAGSFKSVPANVSSGIRSEVQYGSAQSPLEGIVEYDVYYDNFFTNSGHSLQWHPTTSGGSGTGLYHVGNGKMDFVSVEQGTTGTHYPINYTVQTKKWIHMKLQYKFGSSGYMVIFIDGVQVCNVQNKKIGDGSAPYLKVGVNMWANQTSVVYYDNLKVYKK
jgi:hypothetical protein